MMRYLIISLCLCVLACSSYPKLQNFEKTEPTKPIIQNVYFSNSNEDYVYKANIDVYENSFGGLLIIKKIEDENHRIVFTTEMGNKLFDFSFINNTFKVNYIIDDLNKNILINILKKDFKVLITEKLKVINSFSSNEVLISETSIANKTYFYYTTKHLNKIVRVGNGKEKLIFLFSEINDSIAKSVDIIHKNIKLKIKLKSIK